MASQLAPLSASVTRILSLSGFPSELKTRDIQAAFGDWENVNGGFKIKWRDDTSLLIVFADASTAKRAYLQTIASPPAAFSSPTSSKTAIIKPYDGPDAQAVIQAVNARTHSHGHNASRGHHSRSSVSSASMSMSGNMNGAGGGNGNGNGAHARKPNGNIHSLSSATSLASIPDNQPLSFPFGLPRDHSPTLPNVPAHPTLSSLINLSLGPSDVLIPPQESSAVPIVAPADASKPASSSPPQTQSHLVSSPPRVGDPARRMVGHALGIRHPTLVKNAATGVGVVNGGVDQLQHAMGGLSVTDE